MSGAETATLLSTGLEDLRPYFRFASCFSWSLVSTVTPAALGVILLSTSGRLSSLSWWPPHPDLHDLISRFPRRPPPRQTGFHEAPDRPALDTIRAYQRCEPSVVRRVRAPTCALGDANTQATMSTLRVAFLSVVSWSS